MATLFALIDMASHAFGAAFGNVGQCPSVAWEHPCTELLQIVAAVNSYDISHGDHD
jgi:hypothetical protein